MPTRWRLSVKSAVFLTICVLAENWIRKRHESSSALKQGVFQTSTIIEGINPKQSDMPKIVKELKSTFACGGTVKEGFIMLQGDHRDDVKGYLLKMGFNEQAIEVQ